MDNNTWPPTFVSTEKGVPYCGQIMCVRQDNGPQRCSGPNFQNP